MPRTKRVYSVLIPVIVIAFLVSTIGNDKSRSEGGTYWVGAIGWFTFGAALLLTAAFTVIVVVRMTLRRRSVRAHLG
jgi:hypothetical protein